MAAILQVLAALLRSHAASLSREAKGLALAGAAAAAFAGMAGIFGTAFGTHLLARWLGWTWALGLMFGIGVTGLLVAALVARRQAMRLRLAHSEHVAEERLAVRAAVAEAVAASRLSAGLAGVSAALAAVLLLIARRLAPETPPPPEGPPGS